MSGPTTVIAVDANLRDEVAALRDEVMALRLQNAKLFALFTGDAELSLTFSGASIRVKRERPQKPVFSMDFEGPA